MGTVKSCGDLARLKIKDDKLGFYTPNVLAIINDILNTIYQSLVNVNSNLVYGVGTVTTEDGTDEYAPSFEFDGFLRDGSWLDGEDTYLSQVEETDKIKWDFSSITSPPEAFYITEDKKIGYLYVPNAIYTVHHTYWKPLEALTDYEADDLPWNGVWNRVIQRLLGVELLELTDKPSSTEINRQSMFAQIEWDKAMAMVYQRGIRKERQISNMFSVEGI